MKRILIQQGDCIIRVCDSIPKDAERIKQTSSSFVLLKGEGVNTHELQSPTLADDVELYQSGDTLYMKVLSDVPLVHQEHGTEILKQGTIGERIIEREFNYEDMEARNVRD